MVKLIQYLSVVKNLILNHELLRNLFEYFVSIYK